MYKNVSAPREMRSVGIGEMSLYYSPCSIVRAVVTQRALWSVFDVVCVELYVHSPVCLHGVVLS